MKKTACGLVLLFGFILLLSSSTKPKEPLAYISAYKERITGFRDLQMNY
jgi:hypothetical protein